MCFFPDGVVTVLAPGKHPPDLPWLVSGKIHEKKKKEKTLIRTSLCILRFEKT
jgi:hypothetical protein